MSGAIKFCSVQVGEGLTQGHMASFQFRAHRTLVLWECLQGEITFLAAKHLECCDNAYFYFLSHTRIGSPWGTESRAIKTSTPDAQKRGGGPLPLRPRHLSTSKKDIINFFVFNSARVLCIYHGDFICLFGFCSWRTVTWRTVTVSFCHFQSPTLNRCSGTPGKEGWSPWAEVLLPLELRSPHLCVAHGTVWKCNLRIWSFWTQAFQFSRVIINNLGGPSWGEYWPWSPEIPPRQRLGYPDHSSGTTLA